jgi:hypothetical protein
MFAALGIVALACLLDSTVVVTVLPLVSVTADAGHVLAGAGRSVAGRLGFDVIAGAARLAAASASTRRCSSSCSSTRSAAARSARG